MPIQITFSNAKNSQDTYSILLWYFHHSLVFPDVYTNQIYSNKWWKLKSVAHIVAVIGCVTFGIGFNFV